MSLAWCSGFGSVIEEPQMSVESILRRGVKLQHQFHVGEMIPQAGINGFARIREVLCLAGVGRPLTLAEILVGS